MYEAIYRRAQATRFEDRRVPRAALGRMLEAAIWAPNHRLTESWRFAVLDGDSEERRRAAALAYMCSYSCS